MTKQILIAAVAAAFAAAAAAASKRSFSELDKDNDGALSQLEAAGDADAKSDFEKLDKNNDERLSRDEWQAGQSAGAGASGKQARRGGDGQKGSAAVVLVPFVVAQAPNFGNGCWARLYDAENFNGNQLTVMGPADMPNLRTAFGTDWSGSFDSLQVGPKATLTVYDNENYTQKTATYKPKQRVADLSETRGFFEDIRSLKMTCVGGAAVGGTQKQKSQ